MSDVDDDPTPDVSAPGTRVSAGKPDCLGGGGRGRRNFGLITTRIAEKGRGLFRLVAGAIAAIVMAAVRFPR